MKRIIALLLLVSLALSLVSCYSTYSLKEIDTKIPKADVVDIDVEPSDYTAESAQYAVADMGAQMMKSLYTGNQNLLVSPVSVALALGLTAGGAKGETLAQFEKVLGRGLTLNEMNTFFKALTQKLEESDKVEINVANSVWLRDNAITVNKDFLNFAEDNFDADVYNEPFNNKTAKKINDWVDDNTDGMIKKIIDEISPDTVMYLINALAFDAQWQREYTDTSDFFKFINCAGEYETVTGMFSKEARYIEDENTTGFIKNYKGGEYGFAVFLPNEDVSINDYVADITGEKLMNMLSSAQTVSVDAKLPKFTFEYSANLNDTLKAMGLTDAFNSSTADLSGLGSSAMGNLYIGNALHKTFIEVAENGTKAAAVTAVQVDAESVYIEPENIKRVTVNRPFVFAIIDTETNVPLFMGTVLSVAQ